MWCRRFCPSWAARPLAPGARPAIIAAENMYLQGLYQLSQRTENGLRKAMEYFQKAVEEDPGFAKSVCGHVERAAADGKLRCLRTHRGLDQDGLPTRRMRCCSMTSPARRIPHLPMSLAVQDWSWAGSEQEFRQAIRLDPRNSMAHHWYAISCLVTLGRLDEALAGNHDRADASIPCLRSFRGTWRRSSTFRREYDRALEQCDYTIEQNPQFSAAYWTLGLVQEQRGEPEEAIAAFQRAIELSPPSPRIVGALARTYAIMGQKQESLRLLKELNELSRNADIFHRSNWLSFTSRWAA